MEDSPSGFSKNHLLVPTCEEYRTFFFRGRLISGARMAIGKSFDLEQTVQRYEVEDLKAEVEEMEEEYLSESRA